MLIYTHVYLRTYIYIYPCILHMYANVYTHSCNSRKTREILADVSEFVLVYMYTYISDKFV